MTRPAAPARLALGLALAAVLAPAAPAEEVLAVTNTLTYYACEAYGAEDACEGREAAVFYRISFREADAREVYEFFRDDVAAKRDESEMGNKLIREALRAEDYPPQLRMVRHEITLGDAAPEGTDFAPLGEDGAVVYDKMRVRLEGGGRSFDWVRRGAEPAVRLLGKGEILGPAR